jgi:hypothetical protein
MSKWALLVGISLSIIWMGSIVMTTISSIVLVDYTKTRGYHETTCSGSAEHYVKYSQHATAVVTVNNDNITHSIHLYYPPIEHWRFIKTSDSAFRKWHNAISVNNTFPCRVDTLDANGIGVSELYDDINRFKVMLGWGITMSIIGFALIIGMIVAAVCDPGCGDGGGCDFGGFFDRRRNHRINLI